MKRRQFAGFGLASLGFLSQSGCGSVFYPERVGQPRRGPIDWKVAAADGAGLFLFFVPGVIAFAIDYYNGTLFLPSHQPVSVIPESGMMISKKLPNTQPETISVYLEQSTGRQADYFGRDTQEVALNSIDDFWPTLTRLANQRSGVGTADGQMAEKAAS